MSSDDEVEEHEIMPGVYVTHYGKNKNKASAESAAQAVPTSVLLDENVDLSQFSDEFIATETRRLQQQIDDMRARAADDSAALVTLRQRVSASSATSVSGSVHSVVPEMPGFTPVQAVEQLQHDLAARENDLRRLEESQAMLRAALEAEPEDEVIKEALAENEPVLIKKRAEIAALRRELDAKRAALAHA